MTLGQDPTTSSKNWTTKVEQRSRNAVDIAGISEPFEPRHDKTNKMSVRPAKTDQIRPVWSESSLCAEWVAKDLSFLHADSKDSDQTGRMPRLIWVFAGHTVTLLVLSCRGLFDYPPCLNHKVRFSARKAIRIHLPPNKNFSAVPDDISDRNIRGSSPEMRVILQNLTTSDHVNNLCIKCVGSTDKNTVVKCLKTNCCFCGKAIHPWVVNINGYR